MTIIDIQMEMISLICNFWTISFSGWLMVIQKPTIKMRLDINFQVTSKIYYKSTWACFYCIWFFCHSSFMLLKNKNIPLPNFWWLHYLFNFWVSFKYLITILYTNILTKKKYWLFFSWVKNMQINFSVLNRRLF